MIRNQSKPISTTSHIDKAAQYCWDGTLFSVDFDQWKIDVAQIYSNPVWIGTSFTSTHPCKDVECSQRILFLNCQTA